MNRPAKLISGWRLWRAALTDVLSGWKMYLAVVLIVELPSRLLSLSSTLSADGGFNAYATIASLVMNLAVLSVAKARLGGRGSTVRSAYYDGTASFVRYVAASALLALCLLPAIIGFYFFLAGTTGGASLGEALVIGGAALIFVLPTLWLLVRFSLGGIIAATEPVRPVRALQTARHLTLGRFWQVAGRFVVLAFWLLMIGLLIGLAVVLVGLVAHSATFLAALFELLGSMILLPLSSSYLLRLVAALREASTG